METLIIKPRNREEFKLLHDLLKKMRVPNKVLSVEEQEDLGLINLMKQADRKQQVTEEDIMLKLKV